MRVSMRVAFVLLLLGSGCNQDDTSSPTRPADPVFDPVPDPDLNPGPVPDPDLNPGVANDPYAVARLEVVQVLNAYRATIGPRAAG